MKLKEEYLSQIEDSNRIKGLLCAALDKSMKSIEIYCKKNNQLLTTASALKVIGDELRVPANELLEETVHA